MTGLPIHICNQWIHQFRRRVFSRQSLKFSAPVEKQQLNAQNELLPSSLAEKDRYLMTLQQAEKVWNGIDKKFVRELWTK